jgi:hypothetical protein
MPKPEKPVPEVRPRPPNPDDQWVDALRESCARAMAAHLKQSVNTLRPINSMSLPEMMNLAEACTSHWIVETSKKIASEELSPTLREYKNLLLG